MVGRLLLHGVSVIYRALGRGHWLQCRQHLLGDGGPGGGDVGVGTTCVRGGGAFPDRFSGSFVLISHSPLGSGRLGSLLGKDAFHGCCMYWISPPKPDGDKGDLEKTNISGKANKPDHPNSVYPSLALRLGLSRSHGPQLSFNP